jgi:hypothetical protein
MTCRAKLLTFSGFFHHFRPELHRKNIIFDPWKKPQRKKQFTMTIPWQCCGLPYNAFIHRQFNGTSHKP